MAIQTGIAIAQKLVRMLETGLHLIPGLNFQFPATTNGDSQVLITMPSAGRLYSAHLTVPATLGAGAVVKLQKRDVDSGTAVDITAATTAATAGIVNGSGLLPITYKAGDTIEAIVSGANLAVQSSANVAVDLAVQHA